MADAEIAAVIDKMTNSTGLISKIQLFKWLLFIFEYFNLVGGTLFKEKNMNSPLFYEKLMLFDNELEEF